MNPPTHFLAFLQNIGLPELLVFGVIALLLFGRRLPEVGRSLGKGIVEFKRGLREVEDEVTHAGDAPQDQKRIGQSGTPSSPQDSSPPGAGG